MYCRLNNIKEHLVLTGRIINYRELLHKVTPIQSMLKGIQSPPVWVEQKAGFLFLHKPRRIPHGPNSCLCENGV